MGKRSSTSCALGPLDHPQDGSCPRMMQRAKRHRPTVLSVNGECRAEPPERVHANGALASGAGLQRDGAQVTAGMLVPVPPPGGQVLGKSTSSWPLGHLGYTVVGDSYQSHTVLISESET